MYVKSQWKQILKTGVKERLSARDRTYDLHVNVPNDALVVVSGCAMPCLIQGSVVSRVCVAPCSTAEWLRVSGRGYGLPLSSRGLPAASHLGSVRRGRHLWPHERSASAPHDPSSRS
jgi:hypothetical protein